MHQGSGRSGELWTWLLRLSLLTQNQQQRPAERPAVQPPLQQPASLRDPARPLGLVAGLLQPSRPARVPIAILWAGTGCSADKHLGTAGAVGRS